MIATTVPVTIEADAAEQIDKLGLRAEFESILDHVLQTIPGLQRVEVSFPPSYEEPNETVVIVPFGPWTVEDLLRISDDHFHWIFATYPPEVFRYFCLLTCPVNIDEPQEVS
jgi:hypothetical protein